MAKSGVNQFADFTVSSHFHEEFGGTWTDFTPHAYLPGIGVTRRLQRSCAWLLLGLADAVEFLDAFWLWRLSLTNRRTRWHFCMAATSAGGWIPASFGGLERWRFSGAGMAPILWLVCFATDIARRELLVKKTATLRSHLA